MSTSDQVGGWIDSGEAARRLGVKPATLYAYVSRGLLARRRGADGRSLFDPEQLAALARDGGRPRRRRNGAQELAVESRITEPRDGRPFYRGRDALELAASDSFEQVAEWLWTGGGAGRAAAEAGPRRAAPEAESGRAAPEAGSGWAAPAAALAVARATQSALPAGVLPLERLQVVVTALAATDPLRRNLAPDAVVAAGRHLVAGMVDGLPGPDTPGAAIATRLWTKLTAGRPTPRPALADTLRAALVLLADNELAASTLAARVAASVRADPYGVVTTGLGVLGGTLHGGASLAAEALVAEVAASGDAERVISERLRRGERIPGFGQAVYRGGDRRAVFLLDALRSALPGDRRLEPAEAVLAQMASHRLPGANTDFALAVLAHVAGMIEGAGEAVFAVARTAGWLAHAIEEYDHPTLPRPRAIYVGPAPEPRGATV